MGGTGKGDPRAYPVIFAAFKKALDANNFGQVFQGINAIIKLADPRGQEAFDLLKAKFKTQPGILAQIAIVEAQFHAAIKN